MIPYPASVTFGLSGAIGFTLLEKVKTRMCLFCWKESEGVWNCVNYGSDPAVPTNEIWSSHKEVFTSTWEIEVIRLLLKRLCADFRGNASYRKFHLYECSFVFIQAVENLIYIFTQCSRIDLIGGHHRWRGSRSKRLQEQCPRALCLRIFGYDYFEEVREADIQEEKKSTSSRLSGYLRAWATILLCLDHCGSHFGGRKPKAWLVNPLVKMGEWITGAAINVVGSISINFGTNLLKLGHNQVTHIVSIIIAKLYCSSLCQLIVIHHPSLVSKW